MSAPLHRYNNDISEIVNDVGDDRQPIGKNNQDTKVWAEELIRADERAQEYMAKLEKTLAAKREIEDRLTLVEK